MLRRIGAGQAGVAAAASAALSAFAVGATFKKFVDNTALAERQLGQLQAVLKSTRQAAGLSADELTGMADRIARATTFSSGQIIEAQTKLLAFTGIQGRTFEEATKAATDMAARTGMSVAAAAETVGRALDVPSQGLTALSRQGFRFSEETKNSWNPWRSRDGLPKRRKSSLTR